MGVSSFPSYASFASIWHLNAIIFDMRKTLYLKEAPAKLLKTYLKGNGDIYFVVDWRVSILLNYYWKLNQVSSFAKLGLVLRC